MRESRESERGSETLGAGGGARGGAETRAGPERGGAVGGRDCKVGAGCEGTVRGARASNALGKRGLWAGRGGDGGPHLPLLGA